MEEDALEMEAYAELDRRWEQSYGGQIAVLGSSELEVNIPHTVLSGSMRLGQSAPCVIFYVKRGNHTLSSCPPLE